MIHALGLAALLVLAAGILALLSVLVLRRLRRSAEVPAVAEREGLEYAEKDPFATTSIAFPLFRRGEERRVENVVWRDLEAANPTRVFDYGYRRAAGVEDGQGVGHSYWVWFSCALAEHDGQWPRITITHRRMRDKVVDAVDDGDIEFESDEFNETFCVRCEDRRFASTLIDPRMMETLMATHGAVSFETVGRFLLLTADPLDPEQVPVLLRVAEDFLARIPNAVWALYPRFPPGSAPETMALVHDPDAGDPWDPTPGVDYDLDGHRVEGQPEDPWHDHSVREHDTAPPERIWEDDTGR